MQATQPLLVPFYCLRSKVLALCCLPACLPACLLLLLLQSPPKQHLWLWMMKRTSLQAWIELGGNALEHWECRQLLRLYVI
jgi:hypothetical protein